MKSAGQVGRHRSRDRTLVLLTYRHGLRVSEAVALKWDQVDLKAGRIHVNRLKNGIPTTHYLEGDEMRALRRLRREYLESPFVFATERGGPLTRSTVSKLITRAGQLAGLAFPVHPHNAPPRVWLLPG
jgi:integrase